MRKRSVWLAVLIFFLAIGSVSLTQAGARPDRSGALASVGANPSVALRAPGPMTLHRLLSKRLLKALALAEAFGLLPSPVEEDEESFGTNTIVDEPDPVGQSGGGTNDYDKEAQAERERQEKEAEAGKKGNESVKGLG